MNARVLLNYYRAAALMGVFSVAIAQSDFPSISADTQQSRDATRKQILDRELASEQGALAQSQRDLVAAENAHDGPKTTVLRQTVAAHLDNITALKQELGLIPRASRGAKDVKGVVTLRAVKPAANPADSGPKPFWDVYQNSEPDVIDGSSPKQAASWDVYQNSDNQLDVYQNGENRAVDAATAEAGKSGKE